MPMEDPDSIRKCSHCQYQGKVATFPKKKNLSYLKKCQDCHERDKATAQKRRVENASNNKENVQVVFQEISEPQNNVDWHQFKAILNKAKSTSLDLNHIVDLEDLCFKVEADAEEYTEENKLKLEDREDKDKEKLEVGAVARHVARTVWSITDFRFIYKTTHNNKTDNNIKTFQFFCAQFDAEQATKSRLHPDVNKQRSRNNMQRYPCSGWLRITMREGCPGEARINLTHKHHPKYVGITLSSAERESIRNMRDHSPSKMSFSPESLEKTRRAFEDMINIASEAQGVHPQLGKLLKRTFDQVEKVGGELTKEKQRRTMARTIKDNITLDMD
ncbi:hypothetical protein D9757_014563 [Collybiopsis confluens]|uniref:Uncharacterized protein n=1 Tax=Collybiopsis confluens TaxID=2823264 RepID=A0A8H5CIR7_9AGAR|nr:hypothetical protein D9757_014563 [Collybiopsis confluens]